MRAKMNIALPAKPRPPKTAAMNLRIDPETRKRFMSLARRHHVSASYLVQDAIRRFIEEHEPRPDANR